MNPDTQNQTKNWTLCGLHLPDPRVGLWHPDDPNPPAQPPEVHGAAELPVIGLSVVLLDGLEVGGPVEPANRVELTVHNG